MASGCRFNINPVWERPFCGCCISSAPSSTAPRPQPRLVVVAPMSGHYATLLRGTVEAFMPSHDVYVTDWAVAKTVPLTEGTFGLDDYVAYLISVFHRLGGDCHVLASSCQPAVPVLMMAISRMEAEDDPYVPSP